MFNDNIILATDSYKHSHFNQYPPGTQKIFSYIESRGGTDKLVFFGLQAILKAYFTRRVTKADIDEAEELITAHGYKFNRAGWNYIVDMLDGYLPLEICAVPEGTIVKPHVPLITICNTDTNCFWLTSFVEGCLLKVWNLNTIATMSWKVRQLITKYLEETGDPNLIDFKFHDFGYRGVSSDESAALGGLAHLTSFMGTDTILALLAARRFYNEKMAGFSIPAMEHSTVTAWGKDGEIFAYSNMIDQYGGPGKMYACVSDSYDLWNAIENLWGTHLQDKVRQKGGTLIIRPDSGDPVTVVLKACNLIWDKFGGTINNKGYKVFDACVRIIQGDGINFQSISDILEAIKNAGFSADNIAFGCGGSLLQTHNRDEFKFAMKTSAVDIDKTWHYVNKDPITDPGKASKKGLLTVIKDINGEFKTVDIIYDSYDPINEVMRVVYFNGKMVIEEDLQTIRERIKNG